MAHYKVEGHGHLYRDSDTNAVVNKNNTAYNEYIARRNSQSSDKDRIQDVEKELTELKSDIDEIKSLLKTFIQNK